MESMLQFALLSLIVLLIHLAWRRYRLFRKLWDAGHVGPRGSIFFGSFFDLKQHGSHLLFEKWFREYKSDNVGFYYGSQPFVVTRDLDLAKQIIIKDFHNFRNRAQNARLEASHPVIGSHLIFAADDRWKRTRNFMTPSFSTVNMREMYARLTKCTDVFMENLEVAPEESIDFYPLVRRLTLDNISRAAFSIKTDVQNDPFGPAPKFQASAESAIDRWGSLWWSPLVQCFKPIGRFFRHLSTARLVEHHQDPMIRYMEQFINLRSSPPEDGAWVDFMRNIISGGKGETMGTRKFHKDLGFELTENEVIGNCLLFFLAAFETTSSALSFLIHSLAQEPDVQKRLRRELTELLVGTKGELDYDLVMNHRYLDMVVNEGLRLYPTANGFLGREAAEDYEYKGIKIPAGVDVLISAYHIQRDPRNFPDPEKFDPERFSPERKGQIPSMAFLPFGEGQRSCVGNRFALMQMKLLVARLVLKYDISLDAEKHKTPLRIIDRAFLLLQPGQEILIQLSRR